VDYQDETGFEVGRWVLKRRNLYGTGKLSPDVAALFEALPGWTWETLETREDGFQAGLERLMAFAVQNGHAKVPDKYTDDTGFALGNWVGTRRREYKKGRLPIERIASLEALPSWYWYPRQAEFREGLTKLMDYVTKHGDSKVLQGYVDATGFPLGSWVGTRRLEYRKSTLSDERIAALEAIPGWSWNALEELFQEGLQSLREFVAKEGHARVRRDYVDERGFQLGGWVGRRRSQYANGKLSPERIALLESFPGWVWDTNEDGFQAGFERLKKFAEQMGHSKVPAKFADETGFKLGLWVVGRRQSFKAGELSQERVAALETMPGWMWQVHDPKQKSG
jgi:hypothetical protein